MKKETTIIVLMLMLCSSMSSPAFAQSYTSLWKEVKTFMKDDLPKSALKSVDKIIARAHKNGDGGQLIVGLLTRRQLSGQISPDSATAMIPAIERYMEEEQRAEMKSLYHVVLGELYQTDNAHLNEQAPLKSIEHYCRAMDNPELLSKAKAGTYIPFVIESGSDSKYFHGDLLNIVARTCCNSLSSMTDQALKPYEKALQLYHTSLQIYRKQNNREAEFFLMLDSLNAEVRHPYLFKSYENYRKGCQLLIKDFGDLDVCMEAYIELVNSFERSGDNKSAYEYAVEGLEKYPHSKRASVLTNCINAITEPRVSIDMPQMQSFPGQKDSISIFATNLTKGKLRFYHTNYNARDRWERNENKIKEHLRGLAFEIPFELKKGKPYEQISKKIAFEAPEAGIYYIELVSGKNICRPYNLYYVSSLHVMTLAVDKKGTRIVVSEAESGRPISGAKVLLQPASNNNDGQTYTTNNKGEVLVAKEIKEHFNVYVQHGRDNYCRGLHLYPTHFYKADTVSTEYKKQSLFTDRSIYRPGQSVRVGGFSYTQRNDQVSVTPGETITLRLLDANQKELEKKDVVSDAFGAFGADFPLPASCLNGTFSIRTRNSSVAFRVEQYKRPTFVVAFDDVKNAYAAGDTVHLKGSVKTYAGFPISNARVAVSVIRRPSYWNRYDAASQKDLLQDTLRTDENGCFSVPVFLNIDVKADNAMPLWKARNFVFETEAVATLENGETQTCKYNLFAGNRPSYLYTNLPARICKEQMPPFTITQQNAGGKLVGGKARFELWQGTAKQLEGTWDFNTEIKPDVFSDLASGEYHLRVIPADRTDTLVLLKHTFALFSLEDKKPIGSMPLQIYQTAHEFQKGEKVRILVGTPLKNMYLHYDVLTYAKDNLLESNLITLSDSVFTLCFDDEKEAYGDGLQLLFTYVKDGIMHSQQIMIEKPRPDKRLSLRWKTFRDRLRPGQEETWTLQVLRNGLPASASVMATLYDASLDKFSKLEWPFALYFGRNIPNRIWRSSHIPSFNLWLSSKIKNTKEQVWSFDTFDINRFIGSYYLGRSPILMSAAQSSKPLKVRGRLKADTATDNALEEVAELADIKLNSKMAATSGSVIEKGAVEMRSDFNETAYFQPSLITNENGEISLSFRLPQSLTQWNFKALAHTKDMDYGRLDTMAVASKDFMLQPNVPRFLRVGDKTSLAASLRNMTGQDIKGTVTCEWIDPQTQAVIDSQQKLFEVFANGESTVSFPISVSDNYSLLICRMAAISKDFSDGEQHYVPILDDKQEISESIPLSLKDKGKTAFDLTKLFGKRYNETSHRRLTIEYTGNPAWLAIEALPTLSRPVSDDAYSMATAYYSLSLAEMEARSDPAISQLARAWSKEKNVDSLFLLLERNEDLKHIILNETPWVAAANHERERLIRLSSLFDTLSLSYRKQSYVDKLVELQNADGSWSWFKGIPGNLNTTIDIAHIIARLSCLYHAGLTSDKLQQSLQRAERFMDEQIAKDVAEMKKAQKQHKVSPSLSNWQLRYLSICAMRGYKPTSDRAYLIDLLKKESTSYNMYDKSLGTVILAKSGQTNAARNMLRSLMEHTVETAEMGRYFDTDRSLWNWESCRIPTQIAALEAIHALTPEDTTTIQKMSRWLLQAKRTQTWGNPMNSVDAIYYLFLQQNMLKHAGGRDYPKMQLVWSGSRKSTDITSNAHEMQMPATLGYYRRTLSDEELKSQPKSLIVDKTAEPMAFGAVYAQYLMPVSEVEASASGLKLSCSYSVRKGQEWIAVASNLKLHKGDLVRVRHELTADRDYDYVCLKDGRPACMEPVQALSGYDWRNGCYRNVGDASTRYFFQQLPKGKHVIETEMRVDREGTFTSAVPFVQCLYSPEFSGKDKAVTISVGQ